jgi:cytochrome c-type biogenesis protein CcmH
MILRKLGIALLVFFLITSPVRADSDTVTDISKQLMCQCPDCTMVLSDCDCGYQEMMVAEIEQKLAQGQSEQQIIQSFVAQYGEQVLSSPPKRGFSLVAWVLPFAAILGGGGIIYAALKKWAWQGKQSSTVAAAEADERDEEYQQRLERELKEFTERGFR